VGEGVTVTVDDEDVDVAEERKRVSLGRNDTDLLTIRGLTKVSQTYLPSEDLPR